MSSSTLFSWSWQHRNTPLAPKALVTFGASARILYTRLQGVDEEQQKKWNVVASHDLLILISNENNLPWVEGGSYAAPSEQEPMLWLPTYLEPNIPIDLIIKAFHLQYSHKPILVWPTPSVVIPLNKQLPLSDALLSSVDSQWRGIA